MRKEIPISSWSNGYRRDILRGMLLAICLVLALATHGQDEEPPSQKKGVRIAFIPPPMEGTWSLGIYDKKGKLVRVLAREATEKNFIATTAARPCRPGCIPPADMPWAHCKWKASPTTETTG